MYQLSIASIADLFYPVRIFRFDILLLSLTLEATL